MQYNLKSFLFFLLLFVHGCAAGMGSLNVSRKVTNTKLGLTAVIPFEGHDGTLFSDLVANELLSRNVILIERSRLMAVLHERKLQLDDVVRGNVDISSIGRLLGVQSLVFGSVRPIPVYISGVSSGKVAAASVRIVSISNGRVLASATYNNNTDLLPGSPTYPTVAAQLIGGLLETESSNP